MLSSFTYARKSLGEKKKSAGSLSTERQAENASDYLTELGFTVTQSFEDRDISGGEFLNRPGYNDLMANLKKAKALCASEPSRFARDMLEYMSFLKTLKYSSVRLFYYLDKREVNLDDDMSIMQEAKYAFAASQ